MARSLRRRLRGDGRPPPRHTLAARMSTRIAGDDATNGLVAAPDLVTTADLRDWVARAERSLVRHRGLLDRLDARLGDGDHGENMSVGFGDAVRAMDLDGTTDAGELLRHLGQVVV